MKQDSSVFVDDGFSYLGPKQDCPVPGGDGGPLGLDPQLVGGKDGNVPGLQIQLLRRACCLYDGGVRVELHYLNRQHVPKVMVNSRHTSIGACMVQISAQALNDLDNG